MEHLYFPAASGRLFLAVYGYDGEAGSRHWVIHFPAFAEEMNKSRAMVSRTARSIADRGAVVVVPDLSGTGDSEGDFGSADWRRWLADMASLVRFARSRGAQTFTLWGLRLGCLMAAELLASLEDEIKNKVHRVLFWQPVLSGKQHVTQFLRLRVAASMMSGSRITVAELRERSSAGESLEVAGYSLSPSLISQLDDSELGGAAMVPACPVFWYEMAANGDRPLAPASRNLAETWRQEGGSVDTQVVAGEPFWTTQEIAFAPGLVKATVALFSYGSRDDGALHGPLSIDSEGWHEKARTFDCEGLNLLGIIHHGGESPQEGVLVVVGGPQYRVGSHRQFVLLARSLASEGVPVMRFDYRGMGDSEGAVLDFESIGPDIRAAIDCFQSEIPTLEKVVLWGLCDAASASAFYAATDNRVSGLVLLNPWVRSIEGEAKAVLKHYYARRILSPSFWRKVVRAEFDLGRAVTALWSKIRDASGLHRGGDEGATARRTLPLKERVFRGLERFRGKTLLILSGNDLTAAEFIDACATSAQFAALLKRGQVERRQLDHADHTFSRAAWRDQVTQWTLEWLRRC